MTELSRNPNLVARAAASAAEIVAKAKGGGARKKELQAELLKAARLAKRAPDGELFLPRDRATALIQAAMDQRKPPKGAGRKSASAVMMDAVLDDTQFSNIDLGWITVLGGLIAKWLTPDAKFIKHRSLTDFRFPMPNKTSIGLFSDWGTGRPAAIAVADQITRRNVEYMIHLGDIYYAGLVEEVKDRFLNKLPTSTKLRQRFALNGNHEMYSGGHGYFETVLPKFGQPASYFSLVNDHWRIIGLDTAHTDQDLNDPQVDWLKAQVAPADGRRNILMSHHQLFSGFQDEPGRILRRVAPLLDSGKIHFWFWGHEHKHIIYKKHRGVKARCIGHGAIPYLPPGTNLAHPEFKVDFVNNRLRTDSVQAVNGCAVLKLNGASADVAYVDEDGLVSFTEPL
jgi:predicted phosphodiesterase